MGNNIELYEVEITNRFRQDIKYYIKKKKFTQITKDIEPILNDLEKGIFKGDVIPNLKLNVDNKTYKVRAANSNTKMGESNGYRLIYYVQENDKLVFLMTIYYKKEDKRIPSDKEIARLVNEILEEA